MLFGHFVHYSAALLPSFHRANRWCGARRASIDALHLAYFCSPVLIRCRPPRFAAHCRGGWASTGPDRTVGEPEERARAASAGPGGIFGGRLRWARGAECLRAGDSALWPAHCPTFLPVTSRKCFGMLSTAQNRCGVFAGIVATLTGRVKRAFVSAGCTRKTINYAPPAARACMQFRVKQCIIY